MTGEITPELDVESLEVSLSFYTQVIGASVRYARPEEKFAFLDICGAPLMLQEAAGPGRRFRTAPLEKPYGRGINLQIRMDDIGSLHARALAAGCDVVIQLEDKWYRSGDRELGNRQFVLADPDGYLLRPYQDLGDRPAKG